MYTREKKEDVLFHLDSKPLNDFQQILHWYGLLQKRIGGREIGKSFFAIRSLAGEIPIAPQCGSKHRAEVIIIIDDQTLGARLQRV